MRARKLNLISYSVARLEVELHMGESNASIDWQSVEGSVRLNGSSSRRINSPVLGYMDECVIRFGTVHSMEQQIKEAASQRDPGSDFTVIVTGCKGDFEKKLDRLFHRVLGRVRVTVNYSAGCYRAVMVDKPHERGRIKCEDIVSHQVGSNERYVENMGSGRIELDHERSSKEGDAEYESLISNISELVTGIQGIPCFAVQAGVSEHGTDLLDDMKAWILGSKARCKHVLAVRLFPDTLRLKVFSLDFSIENMLDVVDTVFDAPGDNPEGVNQDDLVRFKRCLAEMIVREEDKLDIFLDFLNCQNDNQLQQFAARRSALQKIDQLQNHHRAFTGSYSAEQMTQARADISNHIEKLRGRLDALRNEVIEEANKEDYSRTYEVMNLLRMETVTMLINEQGNREFQGFDEQDHLSVRTSVLFGFDGNMDAIRFGRSEITDIWRSMVDAYFNLQVEFPLTYTDLTRRGLKWHAMKMQKSPDDLVRQSATPIGSPTWLPVRRAGDIKRGVFLQLCAGAGIVIPAGILTVDQLTTPFRQLREFYSRR
jgi:hypothetical protein